jgi:hypothetical protein
MEENDKLDLIIKKLEETEKRLDNIEKKASEAEREVREEEKIVNKEASNIESFLSKKNKLLRLPNKFLVLIVSVAIVAVLVSYALGILSVSPTQIQNSSAIYFNGPIGESLGSGFITALSNLSTQLQSVGQAQLSGKLECFSPQSASSQGPQPGYCVLVLPDQNYAIIPIKVPTNYSAPSLIQNGKPTFVYIGAQGCPYCAQERWAFTIALSRFGNFSELFYDRSATNDGNIATFTYNFSIALFDSFVVNRSIVRNAPYGDSNPTPFFEGAYYHSAYINFEPFDEIGGSFFINSSGLPAFIENSVMSPASSGFGIKNFVIGGVPFFDINNKYVFAGATVYPILFSNSYSVSTEPSQSQILNAIENPGSSSPLSQFGESVLGAANILTAQICQVINGTAPVCKLSYIQNLESKLDNATY